jgi:hypothetical protein
MTHSTIFVDDNTHVLELVGLVDNLGAVQTDATVKVTAVVDQNGLAVTGVTVPITLPHIGSGLYRAILPAGGSFHAGRRYNATFSAIGTQGYHGQWEETVVAQTRRE